MKMITILSTLIVLIVVATGAIAMTDNSPAAEDGRLQEAVLAGGCFWCLEAVFEDMAGVKSSVSGYAGGDDDNPSYEDVCSGASGHAEVVKVTFDPDVVTYRELLEVFFAIHDPTSLNRQGADVGTQYRSMVLYNDDSQHRIADAAIREENASKHWQKDLVTEVVPMKTFYAAEDYHQDYFRRNPSQGYCQAVVGPKLQKFRDKFPDKRR